MRMRVIKSVDTFEAPNHIAQIAHYPNSRQMLMRQPNCNLDIDEPRIRMETVRGRVYVDPQSDREVCIGITKQANEQLGFPFDVFEKTQAKNELLRAQLERLEIALNWKVKRNREISNMGIWSRFRFLLTRKLP